MNPRPTQHTAGPLFVPGPWKYHLGRGANPRFHVQTSGGYQIVSTPEIRGSTEVDAATEANARLVAAAPDLLEALQTCAGELAAIPAFGDDIGKQTSKALLGVALNRARIAIARATGQP